MKGKSRRKMQAIEMSKELKSKAKKSKPARKTSEEHEAYKLIDQGE